MLRGPVFLYLFFVLAGCRIQRTVPASAEQRLSHRVCLQCGLSKTDEKEMAILLQQYRARLRLEIPADADRAVRTRKIAEFKLEFFRAMRSRFGACAQRSLIRIMHPPPALPRPVIQKMIRQRRIIKVII